MARKNAHDSWRKQYITEFDHYFIPARRPRDGARKLMIVLHGRGDSLRPFKAFDQELRAWEMNYLLLNAPRKYDGGYTWYAFPPKQARGVLNARDKLRRLIAELERKGWNSRDIFLFGFSQGCLVSCDFGMNFEKPLGGIIGISGYVYFFPKWRERLPDAAFETPWLITHGRQDVDLLMEETYASVIEMQRAGLPIEWREFNKEHEIDERKELPYIRRWVRGRY